MKRTVLFIDADPTALETFRKWADESVLNIVTLHPDALEMKLVPAKTDVVIINVTTPEGLESLQLLKGNAATRNLHIIALVNGDSLYAGDSSLDTGADGALSLPLDEKSVGKIMTFLHSN